MTKHHQMEEKGRYNLRQSARLQNTIVKPNIPNTVKPTCMKQMSTNTIYCSRKNSRKTKKPTKISTILIASQKRGANEHRPTRKQGSSRYLPLS